MLKKVWKSIAYDFKIAFRLYFLPVTAIYKAYKEELKKDLHKGPVS